MSSGTETSTVLSDAERRVVTIKTEANDIVKYSGNPAELPDREVSAALRRLLAPRDAQRFASP